MKFSIKAGFTALVTVALMGGMAVPAFASEGSFHSSLTQVQPGFPSRTWVDHNSTSNATTVSLSGCTDNAGGGAPGSKTLTSVTIDVFASTGDGDDPVVGSATHLCGTYSFGRLPAGTYYFTVNRINGDGNDDSENFLNASSVIVTY